MIRDFFGLPPETQEERLLDRFTKCSYRPSRKAECEKFPELSFRNFRDLEFCTRCPFYASRYGIAHLKELGKRALEYTARFLRESPQD